MNVLVTGANGFIGRHLCAVLARVGCSVTALSRREWQSPPADRDDASVRRQIRRVVVADLSPETDFQPILAGCDAVVHLAARAHVIHEDQADRQREFHRANVELTERMAADALASGVGRFVYVSSIGVLGNHTDGTPFARHTAEAPAEPYAASKLEAERRLRDLFRDRDSLTIIRPPLVYGPGAKGNFERLIRLVDRLPILPFGAVRARRSCIHVLNLCSFIYTCLQHETHSGVYVICDGEELPLNELCRLVAAELHKKRWLVPLPRTVLRLLGSVLGRKADVDKLTSDLIVDDSEERQLTGWTPPFTPHDGIREMVREYRRKAA